MLVEFLIIVRLFVNVIGIFYFIGFIWRIINIIGYKKIYLSI